METIENRYLAYGNIRAILYSRSALGAEDRQETNTKENNHHD